MDTQFDYQKIKTFEDACLQLGIDPESINNLNGTPDDKAYQKLKIIIKCLNGDWVCDMKNFDQPKYWPYFDLSSGSGFVFSDSYYLFTGTSTGVGSRLCFKNRAISDYCAEQFIDVYKDFLL